MGRFDYTYFDFFSTCILQHAKFRVGVKAYCLFSSSPNNEIILIEETLIFAYLCLTSTACSKYF